jgi:ferredoxin
MTEPTRQMLRDLGVPEGSIRVESFASPSRDVSLDPTASPDAHAAPATMENDDGEASITFALSDKSAPISPNQTVLEAAEALGVAINYDCRAGICGQCKVKRLAGRVVMEAEDALTQADRANDLILSCQARCIDQVVVEA